jgi:predicted RNase H-like nuclease (RuvC/YqgF family)
MQIDAIKKLIDKLEFRIRRLENQSGGRSSISCAGKRSSINSCSSENSNNKTENERLNFTIESKIDLALEHYTTSVLLIQLNRLKESVSGVDSKFDKKMNQTEIIEYELQNNLKTYCHTTEMCVDNIEKKNLTLHMKLQGFETKINFIQQKLYPEIENIREEINFYKKDLKSLIFFSKLLERFFNKKKLFVIFFIICAYFIYKIKRG